MPCMDCPRLYPLCALMLAVLVIPAAAAGSARELYDTGTGYMDRQEYDLAIGAFRQAVDVSPSYFDAWIGLGYACTQAGRFDDALQAYSHALALQPNSTLAWRSLGYVQTRQGNYAEALSAFDQAVALDPADAMAWVNRGLVLSSLGRMNESVVSYQEAIRIQPENLYAWSSLGLEYYSAGRYADALAAYDRALTIDPRCGTCWDFRGQSLSALGRYQEAIEAFSRGLIVDPDNADLRDHRSAAEAQLRGYLGGEPGIPWPYLAVPIVLAAVLVGGFLALRARGRIRPAGSPETSGHVTRAGAGAAAGTSPVPTIPHDVFVSYSSRDKPVADAVCAALETRKIRCWIAPRDVLPGISYPRAIIGAIEGSRVMVLVYSSSSNTSPHVIRELGKAVAKGIIIVPFRIEDTPLSQDMEYLIGIPHWLDAVTPPLERHLEELARTVELLIGQKRGGQDSPDTPAG